MNTVFKNVLDYLEESSSKAPLKIAVREPNNTVTYEKLWSRSQAVGTALSHLTAPNQPIVVYMEKSIDALTMFFGIAQAGCFYVLIDPKHPSYRAKQILSVLEAEIIITSHEYMASLVELNFSGQVLEAESLYSTKNDVNRLAEIRDRQKDVDPLYILFTSGSTGVPKGVVVSHRSVIDFIEYFVPIFGIKDTAIIGNQAPFDFDISVKDIYSSIRVGGELVIIPTKYFSYPQKLIDYLIDNKVNTIIWAVSAMCLLSGFRALEYRKLDCIEQIFFSGERMPIKHLKLWIKSLPHANFVNLYGPTEITCNCSYYIIDTAAELPENLPIGKAFPNEHIFLLDENDKLINYAGGIGEICVSGSALALGYYNNLGQTQKAFIQNPAHNKFQEIIYRTGDLAYYGEEKLLYYAGRKDFQIKHLGRRIELEEIAVAVEKMETIERACCFFLEKKKWVVVVYVGDVLATEIVPFVKLLLPSYMLPNKCYQVEEMPLTKNGKIDRKSLEQQIGEMINE
ncbi:MAG: AMP-binding protein [Culicoidibacterales bacterium]